MKRGLGVLLILGVSFLVLLAGCGGGGSGGGTATPPASAVTVSGVAAAGAALSGTVYLKDSSTPAHELSKTINADGSFSFDVSGLTKPFLLKAVGSANGVNYTLFSLVDGAGTANINPMSHLVLTHAAGGADLEAKYNSPAVSLQGIASNLTTALQQIQTKLLPLLQAYGITTINPISGSYTVNHQGLDGMLDVVRIFILNGTVTITDSSTNAVIFTAPASNILSGTIATGNIPLALPPTSGTGVPIVSTAAVTNITTTTATSGGTILEGGAAVTSRGVCFGTSPNPVVGGTCTDNGTGAGYFASEISGLKLNTTYYVRAYATNAAGTGYGRDVTFMTLASLPTWQVNGTAMYNTTDGTNLYNVTYKSLDVYLTKFDVNGNILWEKPVQIGSKCSGIAYMGGYIYMMCVSNWAWFEKIDAATGNKVTEIKLHSGYPGGLVADTATGTLYSTYTNFAGVPFAIQIDQNGTIINGASIEMYSSIVVGADGVYLVGTISSPERIYVVKLSKDLTTRLWAKRYRDLFDSLMGHGVSGAALSPSGSLFVGGSVDGSGMLLEFDPATGTLLNSWNKGLSAASAFYELTFDSAGNLYLTGPSKFNPTTGNFVWQTSGGGFITLIGSKIYAVTSAPWNMGKLTLFDSTTGAPLN